MSKKEKELSSCKERKCEFYENGICIDKHIFVRSDTGEECCRHHPDAISIKDVKSSFPIEKLKVWLKEIEKDYEKYNFGNIKMFNKNPIQVVLDKIQELEDSQ